MDASPSTSTSSSPPPYPLPPSYTLDARADERVLSRATRRTRARHTETRANHSTKGAVCTVQLRGARQQHSDLPAYGRTDVLDGSVILSNPKRVTNVSVTVEGRLKCAFGEGLADTRTFTSTSYTLWDAYSPSPTFAAVHEAHNFSIPLPATFDDNGTTRPLPSSYKYANGDFRASVDYRLVVCVSARRQYLSKLTQTRRLVVPFAYKPRMRPPRAPLSLSATLLETLKVAPDEWANVSVPSSSTTLQAEIAYPSSRVFAAGQTVPLHVQVSGDIHSLAALASYYPAPQPSSTTSQHAPKWDGIADHDLPTYDSISDVQPSARPSAHSLASTSSFASSSATLVSHPDLPAPATAKSHKSAAHAPIFPITVLLERRIALIGPLGPTWRTQVLASAALHISESHLSDPSILSLDGALVVPDDAALGPAFRVGMLGIIDSLVFAVDVYSKERRAPVVLVSDSFFGDEEEGDVDMELYS